MKKKIRDLTFAEIKRICEKHIIYNRMLCKAQCPADCPLLMKRTMKIVNEFSHYSYIKESCCIDFKENNFSDVERFMNKKVKLED